MFGETGRERKQDGGFKERRKLEAMRKTGPDKQGVVKNDPEVNVLRQERGEEMGRGWGQGGCRGALSSSQVCC